MPILARLLSLSWCLACVLILYCSRAAANDYEEHLLLKPLPKAALLATFDFRSNASTLAFEHQNFGLFPRSLGQILQHSRTTELHLRFSSGRWDDRNWGPRPRGGSREGGTGVELWAWIEADTIAEANVHWLTLTNALSGLFCASLNFIDSTRTTRPLLAFEPEGHANHSQSSSRLHLLHGALPREVVCTENLTPFLKLLPCKGKAGIASLFDGHKLFDSTWQSMAIDVRPTCLAETNHCSVEMEQTIDMVLDIERSKRPRDDPIPRPARLEDIGCDSSKNYHQYGDSCYPVAPAAYPQFTVEQVFGRPIKGSCPLIENEGMQAESLCIDAPSEQVIQINSTGDYTERRVDKNLRCYKLPVNHDFDFVTEQIQEAEPFNVNDTLLFAERTLTGRGQESGGLKSVFTNPSPTTPIEFIYFESFPWFMKPFLHTLSITIESQQEPRTTDTNSAHYLQNVFYRPAVDRSRATQLELVITVPPKSTLTLAYDFEKAILRYAEYPPDANRGFDVAPAIVRILSPAGSRQNFIRTTSLLLYLPTPDFSMPYNVIILTSTVIALGFGSIFNILVRRFVGANELKAARGNGDLRSRIIGRFVALKAKFKKGTKTE